MNNISYISNPREIVSISEKNSEHLDFEFDNILKSCGIRSRSSSDDILSSSNSFKKDEKTETNTDNTNHNEMYCSESSNFPNIPFGSTPPDTHRIKELYIQYMSHIQLKNKIDEDKNK